MNIKELSKVRDLKLQIESYERLAENLRKSVTVKIPSYDGMPKSPSVNFYVESMGCFIAEVSARCDTLKAELPLAMKNLQSRIFTETADSRTQSILILYYVHCMTFESVGKILGYSEKHIRRLHKNICEKMSADVR